MTCGREVEPRYNDIKTGQGGCRFCADWGIDYDAPGMIYLISNSDFQSLKVGISTSTNYERVRVHGSKGWATVRTWNVPTGYDGEKIERSIIEWWRGECGSPEAMTPDDMSQGGWTETASLVHVDLDEAIARIQAEVDRLADE